MLEKIKENKRKLIIIGIILLIAILLTVGIIIATKKGRNNRITEIAKAQEEEYGWDKPYKPEGFTFVEGTVENGYVIKEDSTGNEFVWIPIKPETVGKLQRKGWSKTAIAINECIETLDATFEESVQKYGGYYVARYEAGVPEGKTFETEEEMNISGKPVSKKAVAVWNNINYNNAKASAEQMYATNPEITSSLMNSYAYDTMLIWLESNGINVELDSNAWGNYIGEQGGTKVEKSGTNENWKANNIYDLAGNVNEWTSEESGENYICRGGNFNTPGDITPAGYREAASQDKIANNIGFRPIMYKTGNPTIEGYDDPYIPEGFEKVEGEWDTGFVIKENSTGNEFVWIPVDGYNLNLDRSEFEKTPSSMAKSTDQLELSFKLSVYTYGGYYVGRYEAGIGETSGDNIGVPVSKKGAQVWTNISRSKANQSAQKMYEANNEINSKLMNSYAYDTMLNWLKKTDYSKTVYNVDTDSSSWGNYRRERKHKKDNRLK